MQKIVINRCYGGFSLSDEAETRYREITGDYWPLFRWEVSRNDPALIQVIEEIGDKANGQCADLKIVEIPDGVDWEIAEYDGMEHVAEKHRTWR